MPDNVLTFRVKKDSEFYKKYFQAQAERKHFLELAKVFFDKYDIDGDYYHTVDLQVRFHDDDVRKRYQDQMCVNPDDRNFYRFKKKSPMNKEWRETITVNVDFKTLEQCDLWFLDSMMNGWYSLWHLEDEVYGKVETKNGDEPVVASYMEPIKLSEYYVAVEKAEEIAKYLKGGQPDD